MNDNKKTYKIFIIKRWQLNTVHKQEFKNKNQALDYAQLLSFMEWRKNFFSNNYYYKRYDKYNISCVMNKNNAPVVIFMVRNWNKNGVP